MRLKSKCGTIFASISAAAFASSPARMSLSCLIAAMTSSEIRLISTSGARSSPEAMDSPAANDSTAAKARTRLLNDFMAPSSGAVPCCCAPVSGRFRFSAGLFRLRRGREAWQKAPGTPGSSTASTHDLHRGRENVACAPFGENKAGSRSLRLELPPQAAHLDVDRAVVHLVVVQPRLAEQLVARQDALRLGEERREQVELVVGERHDPAPRGDEPAQPHVQLPAREPLNAYFLHPIRHGLVGARAAEQGADARKQLPWRERLREVVVGAELAGHDPVGFVLAAGEHDDRNLRLLAQPARDLHAVLARQAQVEDDQVHRLPAHTVPDLPPAP